MELVRGEKLTCFVEQSLGNIRRPLSDAQLEDKFRDQAVPKLGMAQVNKLIDLCWRLDVLDDVNTLVEATR